MREISILHRILVWHLPGSAGGERITYSADPRHAEVLRAQCGMDAASTKSVVTPAEKIPATPDKLMPLDGGDVAGFKSGAMRAGYLALDRTDLQFGTKECARGLSAPTRRHGEMLKRVVRYLVGAANLLWVYKRQRLPKELLVWSDTDWAGCVITRRSTSGTVVTYGTHTWLTVSSTQVPVSLSSAEAEFYGLVKAASRGLGTMSLLRDFGIDLLGPLSLRLLCDSSSAIAVATKRGCGKIRHIETGALWIQAAVGAKRLSITKVDGKKNFADILTKAVDAATLKKMLRGMNLVVSNVRSGAVPEAQK